MEEKLYEMSKYESRSITPENLTGAKGKGGMAKLGEGDATQAARDLGQGWKVSPYFRIQPGTTITLADIKGSGIINHIWYTDNNPENRRLILRVYYDGSDVPSIEVPIGDFFAQADYHHFKQVSSLKVCVNSNHAFNCYWEMPFRKEIKITLESLSVVDCEVYYSIDYIECPVSEDAMYLHASFNRVNPVKAGDVYTILEKIEGEGKYVGTYMFWGVNSNGWWGEGEAKFYIDDDDEFPTICGTGTEDYFCGAFDFDVEHKYTDFTTPYSGFAALPTDSLYNPMLRFSMYRWHVTDPIIFHKNLRVTMQDLGWRSERRYLLRNDDISSVAFWYQKGINKNIKRLPSRDELEII